jgi:translocation and assembly module TamB
MVSGTGDLRLADGKLAVEGDLGVDAAYIELAQAGQPTLSSDVVVLGREKKQAQTTPVRLGLDLDLGRRFYFQGAGLESRLAGQLHLSADNRGQVRANGSVRTVEGKFDAYGRELAIERGILNFQGQVDNPGLNVLALRKNLSVEAGVEVTGTVKDPKVRLVSVPDVPDTEKLSWMVLGRPPGQNLGAQDADLLLSAAMALRSNQGKGPLDSLMQQLRLEELGISSGTLSDSGRFPSSHVAGSFDTNGTTAAQQIATVGKRIGSNTVLSYERSLTTAESILKLTVELTRRLSAIGRVGADNSIGLSYSMRFGGDRRVPAAEAK